MPKRKSPLELMLVASTGHRYLPYLKKQITRAAVLVRTRLVEFSIVLVGDKRMSDLHLQFMDIPGPTDVVTFPIDEDAHGRPTAGEVYVCVPEATRQSRSRGTKPRDEVLLYALHGLLHLSGFDDRTEAEYQKMHRAEDDILSRLGVGRVFAPSPLERSVATLPQGRRNSASKKNGRAKPPNRRSRGDRER